MFVFAVCKTDIKMPNILSDYLYHYLAEWKKKISDYSISISLPFG